MAPIAPRIVADPFQRRITDLFEVTEIKNYPEPEPKPVKFTHFVFYLANGTRQVFEFENISTRTRLSKYQRFLARFRISERPQFRILVIRGSSYWWKTLGWREFFDVPMNDTPIFFHMANSIKTLPRTWTRDVEAYLEAL
ncbi:hypothetical protein V5O48_011345 [Marasmius crinis-equi]|uniref:Uncharacterized protein n=1 Tax=Marasmius crinis-equi TaxID=585013 RepID=A0ABR3F5Y3_9AGAR